MKKRIYVVCLILLLSFLAAACSNPAPDEVKKLDEKLLGKVDRASLTTDKLQLLFKALADDSYEKPTMSDRYKILAYTMDLLYGFLGTKEPGDMESSKSCFMVFP